MYIDYVILNVLQEEELFNSDYTLVDRIVDIAEGEDGREYCLTKWKSMTYDGVTWEPLEDIEKENKEKVDQWRTRQIIDKSKLVSKVCFFVFDLT